MMHFHFLLWFLSLCKVNSLSFLVTFGFNMDLDLDDSLHKRYISSSSERRIMTNLFWSLLFVNICALIFSTLTICHHQGVFKRFSKVSIP